MLARPRSALASLGFVVLVAGCAPAARGTPPLGAAASVSGPAPSRLTPPAAVAVYRAIHLDTVLPSKRGSFEDARKEWVSELHRVGASDWRGVFLEVGTDRFYSVRPPDRFGSLDPEPSVPGAPAVSPSPQPSEAAEKRYDEISDASLAFPHTSEIWRADDPLSYLPVAGALTELTAAGGTFTIEDVRADTDSVHRYRAAVREVVAALKEAHYPLTRLAYRTTYGAGHQYTLLLGATPEAFAGAPTVEDVLARERGRAKAKELLAAIDAAVVRRDILPLKVRRDLTAL